MPILQNQPQAQPFLKWAGGKGQLLEQYKSLFPNLDMRSYCEPFVGSGAVFFYLRGKNLFRNYHLSDINEELINCYRAVRDNLDELLSELDRHATNHSKKHYYTVRDWDRDPSWLDNSPFIRAARMIYLNKTCYNGLWRVNSKGYFNVPMGDYRAPAILDAERLEAASEALQGVELTVDDFQQSVLQAGQNDFVYIDPPYAPISNTANFTSYSADSFGEEQQNRLASLFAELTNRGCRVMLSNSDSDFILHMYVSLRVKTLRREFVEARRAINSNAEKRGSIYETVILNY